MNKNRFLSVIGRKPSYQERILSLAPIGYWPLDEASGGTATNYGTLGSSANGAYSGVTLNNIIAPGRTYAPLWDAVNDRVSISTTALQAGFTPAEFTFLIWGKVANAGVWTDGVQRDLLYLGYNSNPGGNYIEVGKSNVANTLIFKRFANGTNVTQTRSPVSPTDWFLFGGTVSESAGQLISYYNAIAAGPSGTGVFTGVTFNANQQNIGSTTSAAGGFSGWLAHAMLWNRALTVEEINSIYLWGGV